MVRRKRNKIHDLNSSPGVWCTDPDILKAEAVKYYKSLFGVRDSVTDDNEGVPSIFPSM